MYTDFASPTVLGAKRMVPRRWEDAAEKWLEERSEKADIRGDRQKLKWLESHFGGKMLHEIDREVVKRAAMALG